MSPFASGRTAVHRVCAVTVLASIAAGAVAQTAPNAEISIIQPSELQWMDGPPSLPPGAQVAVLEGDPSKAEPVTMRLKFPAGYEVKPHTHPIDEHVTVLEGRLNGATGESFDRNATRELSMGTFVVVPAEAPHYVWTDEETVIQLSFVGPFGTTYVDPADDPRRTN